MQAAIAGNHHFAECFDAFVSADGETLSTVAARFRFPEGTARNYRDGESSPSFDRLCEAARHPVRETVGLPDAWLKVLAQQLVGDRMTVLPVDRNELPATARAEDVINRAVEAGAAWQRLLEDVISRAVDGRICREDATSISLVAAECRDAIEQVVLCAMRCARS